MRTSTAPLAAVVAALALAGCGGGGSESNREVEQRAKTAAVVMSRGYDAIPARFAAARVIGELDQVVIDALQASGTTRSGRVVLRIAYSRPGFDVQRTGVTRCFGYDFDGPGDATPHPVDCGRHAALALPDPDTLPTVTDTVRERVRVVLASLPAGDRLDPVRVRNAVRAALGPAYTVQTFRDDASGVGIRVSAADTCVSGSTRPVAMRSTLAGAACQA